MQTAPKLDTEKLLKEIPTFDVSLFEKDKESFAKAIGDGIQDFGFCGLQNHGIPDELIQKAFQTMEAFFALDEDTKKAYFDASTNGQRGYTPFKQERAKECVEADLKEFWHVGRENAKNPKILDNIWPQEIAEFKPVMLEFYDALDKLAEKILSAIAYYLGVGFDFFNDKTGDDDSILRALHYPAQTGDLGGAIRAGAHEDINLITLLVGSNEPGLEILDNRGRWIPVTTIEGTIVCNIGDMLQRFTNDVFPSKTHRVVNPDETRSTHARYSVPFFKHLNPDCLIETIPSCVTEERPNKYEPMTAYQYLIQRLIEIDLIPQEAVTNFDLPLHALLEMKANLKESQKEIHPNIENLISEKS